MQTKIAEQLHQ